MKDWGQLAITSEKPMFLLCILEFYGSGDGTMLKIAFFAEDFFSEVKPSWFLGSDALA